MRAVLQRKLERDSGPLLVLFIRKSRTIRVGAIRVHHVHLAGCQTHEQLSDAAPRHDVCYTIAQNFLLIMLLNVTLSTVSAQHTLQPVDVSSCTQQPTFHPDSLLTVSRSYTTVASQQ